MSAQHVEWLRELANGFRRQAGNEDNEKKAQRVRNMAVGLDDAAAAMEALLTGGDTDAMGGHRGLLKRLRPGTPVRTVLMHGAVAVGEIRAMGRYDFALLRDDGRELVIPKHAVIYWEVMGNGGKAEG